MKKIYCEHGALTPVLRSLQHKGLVELFQFPYDPESLSGILKVASPSAGQWRDMNLPFNQATFPFNAATGSQYLADITRIVGGANRRDALHIDSAFKTGCRIFVTRDADVLSCRVELEALLPIRFFHPDNDADALLKAIEEPIV
ncbi:MAG: hypothetical protein ACYDAB_12605 [bacterium]